MRFTLLKEVTYLFDSVSICAWLFAKYLKSYKQILTKLCGEVEYCQGWGHYFISVLHYKVKKYSKKITKYK